MSNQWLNRGISPARLMYEKAATSVSPDCTFCRGASGREREQAAPFAAPGTSHIGRSYDHCSGFFGQSTSCPDSAHLDRKLTRLRPRDPCARLECGTEGTRFHRLKLYFCYPHWLPYRRGATRRSLNLSLTECRRVKSILIDGQQRVTALPAMLGRSIVDQELRKVRITTRSILARSGSRLRTSAIRRDRAWLADIASLFAEHKTASGGRCLLRGQGGSEQGRDL